MSESKHSAQIAELAAEEAKAGEAGAEGTPADNREADAHATSPEEVSPLGRPKNVARLKLAIAVMSILLVAGTFVVIGTIIYRAMTYEGKSASKPVSSGQGFAKLDVEVERGTLVSQIEIDGDRMAVHITKSAADEILIIDIRSGELLGRVNLREKPAAAGTN